MFWPFELLTPWELRPYRLRARPRQLEEQARGAPPVLDTCPRTAKFSIFGRDFLNEAISRTINAVPLLRDSPACKGRER